MLQDDRRHGYGGYVFPSGAKYEVCCKLVCSKAIFGDHVVVRVWSVLSLVNAHTHQHMCIPIRAAGLRENAMAKA